MAIDEVTLIKAGRELLRWNQVELADRAGVSVVSVRRYESGAPVGDTVIKALVEALRRAGIHFMRNVHVDKTAVVAGVGLRPEARPSARIPNRKPKPVAVVGKRKPGRPKKEQDVSAHGIVASTASEGQGQLGTISEVRAKGRSAKGSKPAKRTAGKSSPRSP